MVNRHVLWLLGERSGGEYRIYGVDGLPMVNRSVLWLLGKRIGGEYRIYGVDGLPMVNRRVLWLLIDRICWELVNCCGEGLWEGGLCWWWLVQWSLPMDDPIARTICGEVGWTSLLSGLLVVRVWDRR